MTSIVILDVETTGKERSRDQIIELCIQRGLDAGAEQYVWRIKPTVPIHPEAEKVHGITAADLADHPTFDALAPIFVPLLAAADVIIGYGVAFDLDMLQAELVRANLPPLDLAAKQVVDVLRLWHHVEPRTLEAAHKKFCGETMANAHAATADVAATGRVLVAMLERFGLLHLGWPETAAIANPFVGRDNWIGPSNHVQWENGVPTIAFGKYRGVRLDAVDRGFVRWVLGKDFPHHVKEIFSAALSCSGDALVARIETMFPRQTAAPTEDEILTGVAS